MTSTITTHYHNEVTRSSSTTTRVRAREEADIRICVESIREQYKAATGTEANEYIIQQTERLLRNGVPYEYFAYAMRETAFAPRPSWRYVMAIIRRLEMQQVSVEEIQLTLSLQE